MSSHKTKKMNKFKSGLYIKDFKILDKLGEGAFGQVLKVSDVEGRIFALKCIKYKKKSDLYYLQREISLQQVLNHPNIVKCYDAFVDGDFIVSVLEYVEGQELLDYIIENERINEKKAKKIFCQLISAMGYLQGLIIVHRDIKPENILIRKDGVVKLTDFGFVNVMEMDRELGSWCGSIHYTSPEILNQTRYNGPEVDNWSTGVVLYSMITGKMLFNTENVYSIREKQKYIAKQISIPEDISKACMDLLVKLLTWKTNERTNILQIVSHPWICENSENIDFHLPKVEKIEENLNIRLVKRVKNLCCEKCDMTSFLAELRKGDSIPSTMYIFLRRQKKFDMMSRFDHDLDKDSKEARKQWTDRILYIYEKLFEIKKNNVEKGNF